VKRVLRPDGVTMHGIECTDHAVQKNYDEMSPEELRRFIEVDGHVGLEEEQEHGKRFLKFFKHVAWEPRYALCLSSEEFLKQADHYGLAFESDFLDYLRGLSFKERRAFDMAMGYVFGKISDLNVSLPKSGLYVFLKASDIPIGRFYNEHRDRSALYASDEQLNGELLSSLNLIRNGWVHVDLQVPQGLVADDDGNLNLSIRANRTWQPRPTKDETRDDREISIAVCNLEVIGDR